MMYTDFIRIKSLQGELKISHKQRHLGLTVSTEELVIQKPHINYHIPLDQIISIIPYENAVSDYSYVNREEGREEITRLGFSAHTYRIYVKSAVMHTRSGIFPMERMEFIVPLHPDLLAPIQRYSELSPIP